MALNYKELLLNIDNYPTIRKIRYDLIKLCQEDTLKMNSRYNVKYEINYNVNEVKELYGWINQWVAERYCNSFYRHNNEDHYYRDLYYLAMNEINKCIYYNVEENTYNNLLKLLNTADYDFYLSVIINNISKYVVNVKINVIEIKNILYSVRNSYGWMGYVHYNLYDDFYHQYNDLVDAFYNNKYIVVSSNTNRKHIYKIVDDETTKELNKRIKYNSNRVNSLKKYNLLVYENNFENMFVNPDILCGGLEITESKYYIKFSNYDSKTKIYTVDIYI